MPITFIAQGRGKHLVKVSAIHTGTAVQPVAVKALLTLRHDALAVDVGPQGGLVNVKGQLPAVILPQQPPILFISIMDGVNSSGIDTYAQRGVPVGGIAAGHSEIAPKRTVYIGELGVR